MLALAAFAMQVDASGCAVLCDADRLQPYFARLDAARRGGAAVHIVQIGDSHTAGDQVTGSWRTILQSLYGSAGRGVLPPGRPYNGYLTRGVTASQSAGWSVSGLFGNAWHGGGVPIGLSGYSLTAQTPGASLSLVADGTELFDLFTVCALRGPGQGVVTLAAGATVQSYTLDAPASAPACMTVSAGGPTTNASVSTSAGPVTLTSWATARSGQGGVILSNLGTVGAQLVHFGRADDRVLAIELDTYRPDLLVVAFGTNEAFVPDFDPGSFEATLRSQVARLKRMAPGTPILLLGAPDSGTRRSELIGNAYGSAGTCQSYAPTPAPSEEPVEPALEQLPPQPASGAWAPTRALPLVQAIQRRVAHQLGIAFWDWSARMGGRCTASSWAALTPPLMRGDHVHFTTPGAAEIARRLQADLGAAAGRASSPQPATSTLGGDFVITPGGG